jgi:hypothetical protein
MSPPELEAAIQRYEAAIASLQQTIHTIAIARAKIVQDRVFNHLVKTTTRDALNSQTSKLDLQQVTRQATQQVMSEKSLEAIAAKIINLAFNPDATDVEIPNFGSLQWHQELDKAIDTAAQGFLQELSQELTDEQILEVLTARDGVQWALSQETPVFTGNLLEKLHRGDRYLKSPQWQTLISLINLDEWREMFHLPQTAWWWYCQPKPSKPIPKRFSFWDLLDLPCDLLTWFCLTICVSLVGNMATQVFDGNSDNVLGIFALISPTVLTFFSGKQALTKKGKEDLQIWLESWNIHKKYIHEVIAAISLVLCVSIWIFYNFLVPNIAYYLGQRYQESGELKAAQQKYELAVNFQYTPAYLQLARVLVEQGKPEYEAAEKTIREGLQVARAKKDPQTLEAILVVLNQLARAYNLQKNTNDAILLVSLGWQNSNELSTPEVIYNLHLNLGWAYLNQQDYASAKSWLSSAETNAKETTGDAGVKLSKKPDHYCLLALTYREINQNKAKESGICSTSWEEEKKYWEQCNENIGIPENSEQLEWIRQYEKRWPILEKINQGEMSCQK